MWIELKAKMMGYSDFETQGINTDLIDTVKPGGTPDTTCWIWSIDAVPVYEVQMPYKELLAKLNGEDLKQPADEYDVDVKQDACPRKEHDSVELLRAKGFEVEQMFTAVGTTGRVAGWFKGQGHMGEEIVVGHLQADFINRTVIMPESIRFVPKA